MKNINSNPVNIVEDDEMLPEYDFANMPGGVRGKYAAAYREGGNIIARDPDVNDVLPDEDEKC